MTTFLLVFALKDLMPTIDCFPSKNAEEAEVRHCVGPNVYYCSCFNLKEQPFRKQLLPRERGDLSNSELKLGNGC